MDGYDALKTLYNINKRAYLSIRCAQIGEDSNGSTVKGGYLNLTDRPVTIHSFVHLMNVDILKKVLKNRVRESGSNRSLKWLKSSKPIKDKYADIVMMDGDYLSDPKLYDIKSDLKSVIGTSIITNKVNLHQYIKDDSIPETYVIVKDEETDFSFMDGKNWWIWRPEGGYHSKGIKFIKYIEDAIELQSNLKVSKSGRQLKGLLSRVIVNPMLYYPNDDSQDANGYKFHLRMHLIVYKSGNNIKSYLVKKGRIMTTNTPYKHSDFDNISIHDSKGISTIGNPIFPDDCHRLGIGNNRMTKLDCDLALESMADILKIVMSNDTIKENIQVFPESESAYQILGCDIMIDQTGKMYLIEINDKIGMSKNRYMIGWLTEILTNAVFESVIGPRYFGTTADNLEYTIDISKSNHVSTIGGGLNLMNTQLNKTYITNIDQLDKDMFVKMAKSRGWKKIKYDKTLKTTASGQKVGLVFFSGFGVYDKRFWGLPSTIKSVLMSDAIANKTELHKRLIDAESDAIPETIIITPNIQPRIPLEGEPWIWRPEGGMMGQGVAVITTQSELDELWESIKGNTNKKNRALLTKYIDNPALFELDGKNYKFHLRMYLLIISDGESSEEFLFRNGRLFHAKSEYTAQNYTDVDIHDTHLESSTPDLKFPENYPTTDYTNPDDAFDKMTQMMSGVMRIIRNKIKPYPENELGFEIYGVDIMVDDTGRPWLLEINSAPGLADNTEMKEYISEFIIGGIEDTVFAQIDGESVKDTYLVRL
jgi:Tubulin-tyrosine ligase family